MALRKSRAGAIPGASPIVGSPKRATSISKNVVTDKAPGDVGIRQSQQLLLPRALRVKEDGSSQKSAGAVSNGAPPASSDVRKSTAASEGLEQPVSAQQTQQQLGGEEVSGEGPNPVAVEASVLSTLSDARNPLKALQRLRQNPDSTEFVYLRPYRIDDITPLNPYHLEIVPHSDIDESNFYTLSSFGVTYFMNGKPEFTELEQWKREHYLFNAIIKIPVFKKYRVWKSYKVWRDSVRYGKMRKCAKLLNKNLFWMNPTFQEALFKIRGMCMDVKKTRLHSFQKGQLCTLEQFFHDQQVQRGSVLNELDSFWTGAIECARVACISTLESLEEGLFGSNAADAQAASNTVGGDKQSPRAENFRYTVMASKRVVQRRLYFFLRLCDYMIFNTLHSMVVESVSELLGYLQMDMSKVEQTEAERKAAEKKKLTGGKPEVQLSSAIFLTEIMLMNGDLAFIPGANDFEAELESIVGGFVDTVSGSIRLLNHEDLEQYTELYDAETEANEGSTVGDIVTNDEEYQGLVSSLKDAVEEAFVKCNQYLKTFEKFRDMVSDNKELNVEELRDGAAEGEVSLDDFEDKLKTFGSQRESIRELPDASDIGIIRVDTTRLKEEIAPSPAACLQKIEELLPQLAAVKQKSILDEVNAANNRLNKKPETVEEFVSLLGFISELNETKDKMEEVRSLSLSLSLCVCVCVSLSLFVPLCAFVLLTYWSVHRLSSAKRLTKAEVPLSVCVSDCV